MSAQPIKCLGFIFCISTFIVILHIFLLISFQVFITIVYQCDSSLLITTLLDVKFIYRQVKIKQLLKFKVILSLKFFILLTVTKGKVCSPTVPQTVASLSIQSHSVFSTRAPHSTSMITF
jgi:hypothetical protein